VLDEDRLLNYWNDGDVSFLPDLWNFLHNLSNSTSGYYFSAKSAL
jgi:hypothetical protein